MHTNTDLKRTEPLLELRGISKRFTGVLALDRVDLDVRAGELHVLFGENGAGKSTLINVIAGTFPPNEGTFRFGGEEIRHLTPQRARGIGISPVFQEFSLVPSLTVEENLFLGREISSKGVLRAREMRKRAQALIDELGFDLDPSKRVDDLSRAHQQMAEIAKALLGRARLLILDEPTASLTERETGPTSTDSELVELMTGRKIDLLFPTIRHKASKVLVDVENLTLIDGSVRDVNFHARAGEITGIAGLVGCGKSELIRAIYGLESIASGVVRIDGTPYEFPVPRRSLKRGVAYFPANRIAEGLALSRPIRENASMTVLDLPSFARFGVLRQGAERATITAIMEQLQLRPPNIERAAGALSGGNRQKVMLGRALTRDLAVFLFDEPSVGIDVGAKLEVYEFMKRLVEAGAAVIVVSSELPEVLALSNRLYVMHNGRIAAELKGAEKTEQNVLASFFKSHITAEVA